MADPDTELELSLLRLVEPARRARMRAVLTPTKSSGHAGRRSFLATLFHAPPFDDRYVTVLTYQESFREAVLAALVTRGAPEQCYVMSTWSEFDGTTVPLGVAVDSLCGRGDGTILLCIPGRLAYYEGEESIGGGYQWIVERPA